MFTRGLFISFLLIWVILAGASTDAFAARSLKVLFYGDSLMSGYGLVSQEDALPAVLKTQIQPDYPDVEMNFVNASVAGDTTGAALARIQNVLSQKPNIVVVGLGGNDALRGVDPEITRNNMDQILSKLKEANMYILLVGMRASPSMGLEYTSRFNEIFPALAERHHVMFIPFILEGVVGRNEYNQRDGIHPNEEGVKIMARTISETLLGMIRKY